MIKVTVEVNEFCSMENIHQPSKGCGHKAGLCGSSLTQVWNFKQSRRVRPRGPQPGLALPLQAVKAFSS